MAAPGNSSSTAVAIHRQVSQEIADHSIKTVEAMLKDSLTQVLGARTAVPKPHRHNTIVSNPNNNDADSLTNYAAELRKLVQQTNVSDVSLNEDDGGGLQVPFSNLHSSMFPWPCAMKLINNMFLLLLWLLSLLRPH